MTKKLLRLQISILFTLLTCVCLLYAQYNSYRLTIKSNYEFQLFINDQSVFSGKYFDTTLIQKKYKVEAFLRESTPELFIFKQNIELLSDTLIELNQPIPFSVKTKPSDAKVFIDSTFFGYTPIRLNLLFKPKLLNVQYNDFNKEIQLGQLDKYDFEIDFNQSKTKEKILIDPKYIALTTTIINGFLSTYFKQKADKYYYKPDRTQNDLDLVRKYDKLSAAFTIGMEISFGIFVYMLFKE